MSELRLLSPHGYLLSLSGPADFAALVAACEARGEYGLTTSNLRVLVDPSQSARPLKRPPQQVKNWVLFDDQVRWLARDGGSRLIYTVGQAGAPQYFLDLLKAGRHPWFASLPTDMEQFTAEGLKQLYRRTDKQGADAAPYQGWCWTPPPSNAEQLVPRLVLDILHPDGPRLVQWSTQCSGPPSLAPMIEPLVPPAVPALMPSAEPSPQRGKTTRDEWRSSRDSDVNTSSEHPLRGADGASVHAQPAAAASADDPMSLDAFDFGAAIGAFVVRRRREDDVWAKDDGETPDDSRDDINDNSSVDSLELPPGLPTSRAHQSGQRHSLILQDGLIASPSAHASAPPSPTPAGAISTPGPSLSTSTSTSTAMDTTTPDTIPASATATAADIPNSYEPDETASPGAHAWWSPPTSPAITTPSTAMDMATTPASTTTTTTDSPDADGDDEPIIIDLAEVNQAVAQQRLASASADCDALSDSKSDGGSSVASVAFTQPAWLVIPMGDRALTRLAAGQYCGADGTYVLWSVSEEGSDFEVGGMALGRMPAFSLLSLEDLQHERVAFETDAALQPPPPKAPAPPPQPTPPTPAVRPATADAATSPIRIAVASVACQTSPVHVPSEANKLRFRVAAPEDDPRCRRSRLVGFQEYVRLTCGDGQTPEVLVGASQLAAALATARAWKSEVTKERRDFDSRLEAVEGGHADELRRRDCCDATKAKRRETWAQKRAHIALEIFHLKAKVAKEQQKAADAQAKLIVAEADAQAKLIVAEAAAKVQATLGVAQQRQHRGIRAPFTFATIHRDLRVRRLNQSSGAANLSRTTAVYSQTIAADGRDLRLESGSERSVLRWEKLADMVHVLLEKEHLHETLREHPDTRLWFMCDLSPCEHGEIFGMLMEYAGFEYALAADADAVVLDGGAICGARGGELRGVQLGDDGCPILQTTWQKRVFLPLLAANGPKYAANRDCFTRNLQLYGLPNSMICAEGFKFVSHAVGVEDRGQIPLLEYTEGIISDAGGEVHKTGGLLDTLYSKSGRRHAPPPPQMHRAGTSSLDAPPSSLRLPASVQGVSYVVIDIETSPQMVLQLGVLLCDASGREVASHEQIWQLPRGQKISYYAWRAHRIDSRMVRQLGVPAPAELTALSVLCDACKHASIPIIFHNAGSDVACINRTAAAFGLGREVMATAEAFCTMRRAAAWRKPDGSAIWTDCNGRPKPPKNSELYEHLFHQQPVGTLHRALADCRVTAAAYHEGESRSLW